MSPPPTAEDRNRFEAAQAAIAAAARAAEEARLSLFAARQFVARADRHGLPKVGRHDPIRDRATTARDRMTTFTNEREAFKAFTDPRTNAPMLDDATPFLLFPLRLETRFASVPRLGALQPQLWVRVYPDDCLIDSFLTLPAETEI